MDGAEAGRRPGWSILRPYVRTRTRPGDRARRKKIPAALPPMRQGRTRPYRGNHTNLRISPMTSMATLNNCPMVKTPRM